MLTTLGRLTTARPKIVLFGVFLFVVLGAAFGGSVATQLKAAGFAPAQTEADWQYIRDNFPGATANLLVLVSSADGVRSPLAVETGERLADDLRKDPDVASVTSWTDDIPGVSAALVGRDGHDGLLLVDLKGDDNAIQKKGGEISKQVAGTTDGVTIRTGGIASGYYDMNAQVGKDLAVAEAIALPLTLVLLIFVFGSVVAASLPLLVGIISIVATLATLRVLTVFTDVSVFALNIATALGLALAIDYSLFIVSRYREELARGLSHADAVIRTMQTAGRTVCYSAATVALSLSALMVFDGYALRSFAYAGVAVTVVSGLTALVVLPACLVLLGDRIDALDLRKYLRRLFGRTPHAAHVAPENSRWYAAAAAVMRRAVPAAVAATVLSVVLAAPFLGVQLGFPDDRAMTESAPSRQVGDIVRSQFGADLSSTTTIALPGFSGDVGDYAARLSSVADVPAVVSATGTYSDGERVGPGLASMRVDAGTYLAVRTTLDPYSQAGRDQVDELRAVAAPGRTIFGGLAPVYKDALDSMYERLPVALLLIAVSALVLLFLFTGSVVLPIKALVLNLLSLCASFGALVWIFQDGHLASVLGFTPTGYLNATMPILMFCLAFGMSMDYEVFLLSRIREEWLASDRTAAANTHAIAMGIARTGRIFTAAAGLMIVIFAGLVASEVSFMQMLGIGLVLALIADATVIRLCLAPATMKLMGVWNWWSPPALAKLHARLGLAEERPATDGRQVRLPT